MNRGFALGTLAFLTASAFGAGAASLGGAPASPSHSFPSYSLETLDGARVVISASSVGPREPLLAFVFLSMGCMCSPEQMQEVAELPKQFAGRGVRFIGVEAAQFPTPAERREFYAQMKYPFPVYFDRDLKLAGAYKVGSAPAAVLLKAEGGVEVYRGAVREPEGRRLLLEALEASLAGRAPAVAKGPMLGCALRANLEPALDSSSPADL